MVDTWDPELFEGERDPEEPEVDYLDQFLALSEETADWEDKEADDDGGQAFVDELLMDMGSDDDEEDFDDDIGDNSLWQPCILCCNTNVDQFMYTLSEMTSHAHGFWACLLVYVIFPSWNSAPYASIHIRHSHFGAYQFIVLLANLFVPRPVPTFSNNRECSFCTALGIERYSS